MKRSSFILLILLMTIIITGCNKTIFVKSYTPQVYVPAVRSPEPVRIEKPKAEIKYTRIKIKVLKKYEKTTYNKMYNNPFNRNDGLTFSNWDNMYNKLMKEYEIKPEDSEKMKEIKKMNKELQNKLKDSGLSDKQIRRFYVLN